MVSTWWCSGVTRLLVVCIVTARLDSVTPLFTTSGPGETTPTAWFVGTQQVIAVDGSATVVEGRVNIRLVVPAGANVSAARDAASFTLLPAASTCPALRNKTHCTNGATVASIDSCPGRKTWKCPNHPICLPKKYRCNDYEDCPDGADEAAELCETSMTSTAIADTSTTMESSGSGEGSGDKDEGGEGGGEGVTTSSSTTRSSTSSSPTTSSTDTTITKTTTTLFQPNQCTYQIEDDDNDDTNDDGTGESTCKKSGDEGQWKCPGEDKEINCEYVCDEFEPADCTSGADEDEDFCNVWKASSSNDDAAAGNDNVDPSIDDGVDPSTDDVYSGGDGAGGTSDDDITDGTDDDGNDSVASGICENGGMWSCFSNEKEIQCDNVCDGVAECSDSSDEDPAMCNAWTAGGDTTTVSSSTTSTSTTIQKTPCEWSHNSCDGKPFARAANVALVDVCQFGATDRACGVMGTKVFLGSVLLPNETEKLITVKFAVVDANDQRHTVRLDVITQTTSTTTKTTTTGPEPVCADVPFYAGIPWHDNGGRTYNCEWYGRSATRRCPFADNAEGLNEGLSARDACCVCGGGIQFGPGYEPDCEDKLDEDSAEWHDAANTVHTCAAYSGCDVEGWCASYGSVNASKRNGMSANDACCVCGGGERNVDELAKLWRIKGTAPPPITSTVTTSTATMTTTITASSSTTATKTSTTTGTTTTQTRKFCNDTRTTCPLTASNGGCILEGILGETVRKACPWSCYACPGTTTTTTSRTSTITTLTITTSTSKTSTSTTSTTTITGTTTTSVTSTTTTKYTTHTTFTSTATSTMTTTPTTEEVIHAEFCTSGILSGNGRVCCSALCGQCGGGDCLAMDGGMHQCCIAIIQLNGDVCTGKQTGCTMPMPSTSSTSPTTTPTTTATTSATSTRTSTATSTATSTPLIPFIGVRSATAADQQMGTSLAIAMAAAGCVLVLLALAMAWRAFHPPKLGPSEHIHIATELDDQLSQTYV